MQFDAKIIHLTEQIKSFYEVCHVLQEDVQLMVNTGLEAYRFSISWSRLIPSMFHVVMVPT